MKLTERILCVEPSPPREIFDLAMKLDDVVDLTLGDPDLPPPLNVRQAACDAIMAGKTRYSANAGLKELRRQIASDLKLHRGIEANPDTEIIVTVGAMEASFLTLYALVDPGDEVVIHAPYWINYSQVVRSLGGIPVFAYTRPEDGFQLRATEIERLLTPRTKVVVLNSPNNPTGAIIPQTELKRISELSIERGFIVLSDEIYGSLVYDGAMAGSIAELPGMKERTVIIDGLSKRFAMTGWRLGWAVGPEQLISQMVKMQENIVACAPLPAQYAAIEALEPHTDASFIRDEFQKRRNVVYEGISRIPGLKCIRPQATFYAMTDISSTGLDSKTFALRLLESKRVAVVHGAAYGGKAYDGFIRIAFTMKEERLKEGLRRLAAFVDELSAKGE